MIYFIFLAANALKVTDVTGTTPPAIDCPNKLCHGRVDGNYYIPKQPNYFVQCVSGLAYCQACWPLRLEFSQRCNQCLYSRYDACVTTEKWHPAPKLECPDICPKYGHKFSGNVADGKNPDQYVACWNGITAGCIKCPAGLLFNEKWNACLYEGKFKSLPGDRVPHKPEPKPHVPVKKNRYYYGYKH